MKKMWRPANTRRVTTTLGEISNISICFWERNVPACPCGGMAHVLAADDLLARRFGFKCETCAVSSPCPTLQKSASGHPSRPEGARIFEAAAAREKETDRSVKCVNESVPCAECSIAPVLGAFQQLRCSSTRHEMDNQEPANKKSIQKVDCLEHTEHFIFKHAHVWRSLCRRALWKYSEDTAQVVTTSRQDISQPQTAWGVGTGEQMPQTDSQQSCLSEFLGEQPLGAAAHIARESERARERESHIRHIAPERLCMHRHKESCWLAANGKVFDVTLFLSRHPAGPEVTVKYSRSNCRMLTYADVC